MYRTSCALQDRASIDGVCGKAREVAEEESPGSDGENAESESLISGRSRR